MIQYRPLVDVAKERSGWQYPLNGSSIQLRCDLAENHGRTVARYSLQGVTEAVSVDMYGG